MCLEALISLHKFPGDVSPEFNGEALLLARGERCEYCPVIEGSSHV